MSRYIDRMPEPVRKRDKKVIVASYGRNGTLGLYQALKILGFKPYHMITETFRSESHSRVMEEAVQAASLGKGPRWTRDDYEKWLGDYDSILDITSFLLEDFVSIYPEAKYILTYREPEAWLRSVNNAFAPRAKLPRQLPFSALKYFDSYIYYMFKLQDTMFHVLWRGKGVEDGDAALQTYQEHNELARRIIPHESLLTVKLEDGLGWEQICPFLDVDIPDVPYPRTNDAATYAKELERLMKYSSFRAIRNIVTFVVVPIVAGGAWYYFYD